MEECYYLLESSFFSVSFAQMFDLPSYWQALLHHSADDAIAAYEYYRRQLQLLQYRVRGRYWLSKTPVHSFFLDALLSVFPTARVVVLHRDPLECIPSACSLVASVRALFMSHLDLARIGTFALETYVEAEQRTQNARKRHPAAQMVDVEYTDLVADPLGVVRRVCADLGEPFSADLQRGCETWLRENPQHKHGVHRYSLSQFGLTEEQVNEAIGASAPPSLRWSGR